MNKLLSKWKGTVACSVALAAFPATSSAITISFVPSTPTFEVGELFDIDVVVSDVPSDQIVSGFELDVTYDETVLGVSSLTFGAQFGFTIASFTPLPGGVLDVALSSFELDTTLMGLQGSSVTLFTIEFQALNVGSSPLDFGELEVLGIREFPFTPTILEPTVIPGEVEVVEAVAEPSAGFLAFTVVAYWIGRTRRYS